MLAQGALANHATPSSLTACDGGRRLIKVGRQSQILLGARLEWSRRGRSPPGGRGGLTIVLN